MNVIRRQDRLLAAGLALALPIIVSPNPSESRIPNSESQTRTRALAAWATVCIVWGTTYLAIRIALETIPPLLMPAMRYTAAGAILACVLRARGERPGSRLRLGI